MNLIAYGLLALVVCVFTNIAINSWIDRKRQRRRVLNG